jgi:hypothetical protein
VSVLHGRVDASVVDTVVLAARLVPLRLPGDEAAAVDLLSLTLLTPETLLKRCSAVASTFADALKMRADLLPLLTLCLGSDSGACAGVVSRRCHFG